MGRIKDAVDLIFISMGVLIVLFVCVAVYPLLRLDGRNREPSEETMGAWAEYE